MRARRRGLSAQYRFPETGTRFLLYPQARTVRGFELPRLVRLAARPGTIGPGPRDARLEVIDALHKAPYRAPGTGEYVWRPPYPRSKPRRRRVRPSAQGHFDHLVPGTPAFAAAATFAAAACALDVWEHYLGRLRFRLNPRQRRFELIPRVRRLGDNAYSGVGYVEFGFAHADPRQPYCENLDVVAHEVGHHILRAVLGPTPTGETALEHKAHAEAAADLVSLVVVLHFDRVVSHLLEQTRGKLYSENVASQIGEFRDEWSGRLGARTAFHDRRLEDVARARRKGDFHAYGRPFLGAAYEVLVEIYESHLVRRELISPRLARRSSRATARSRRSLRGAFAARFRLNPDGFGDALRDATADFARLLAAAWTATRGQPATFARVARNLVRADRRLTSGRYGRIIRHAFGERGIATGSRRA